MASGPVVELIADGGAPDVLALLDSAFADVQRTGDIQRQETFWHWKYRSSPFGEAAVQTIRIENRLAAAGCLWPMKLHYQGSDLMALQASDTAVNPDFRRMGLFGKLNRARQAYAREEKTDLIFNFPNANSLPGYLKAGWKFVGRVPWFVRVMKPLSVVRDRMHGGKANMAIVPAPFLLKQSTTKELDSSASGAEVGVSLERPAGYWRWRFLQHPSRQYGLVRNEHNANDFAIFTLSRKESELIEMVVVDLVAKRCSLPGLLKALLRCARQVDAGFVALMKPKGFPALTFYRYGFMPTREKNLVYWPVHSDLPAGIGDIRNWNFRTAMHDSI